MTDEQKVSEQELEQALRSLALLIQKHGQKYWPIFDRIDQELKKIQNRKCKLAAVLGNR